jgi:hypothetical protein
MTLEELQAIVRGITPAIKQHVSKAIEPIAGRIDVLERNGATVNLSADHEEMLADAIAKAINYKADQLLKRIEALEERPTMQYRGVFAAGQTYHPGDFCTWGGSLWACRQTTTRNPAYDAESAKVWTLAVKHGRDGKDVRS